MVVLCAEEYQLDEVEFPRGSVVHAPNVDAPMLAAVQWATAQAAARLVANERSAPSRDGCVASRGEGSPTPGTTGRAAVELTAELGDEQRERAHPNRWRIALRTSRATTSASGSPVEARNEASSASTSSSSGR